MIALLGFLDGQTTNPALALKNSGVRARLAREKKFSSDELLDQYRDVVTRISDLIPDGSVSVGVYADQHTSLLEMSMRAEKMFSWIPNAHIKLPILPSGLSVAEWAVYRRMRVDMALCFSQVQAAAVYAATVGAKPGEVFLSLFIGRLYDCNTRGIDLVANILQMYRAGDGHVQVSTANVLNLGHLLDAFALGSDIVTAPASVLREWAEQGFPVPVSECPIDPLLSRISYDRTVELRRFWWNYVINNPMTDSGVEQFAADWNASLRNNLIP